MSKAKRLTDSNKWDDPWFMELENDYKLVWLYLLDKCDHAGIYKINLRLLNFHTQANIKGWGTIEEAFGNRLVTISEELCFIPKFLKFQYDKGLNAKNNCLKSVRDILEKYDLSAKVIELFGSDFLTLDQGLNNPSPRVKEKEKEKDKEKDKEIGKNETLNLEPSFEEFYDKYAFKQKPREAEKMWKRLSLSEKEKAINGIDSFRAYKEKSGEKIPYPASYLSSKRWEDDFSASNTINRNTTTTKKGDSVNGWFKNK